MSTSTTETRKMILKLEKDKVTARNFRKNYKQRADIKDKRENKNENWT